ncbi:lysozyme inhibitor LprI family protein [Bacillus sp. 37MA]|uniref:lysozyme inhibitor LprI family protein n=1 Tax=Bacillus sp. 37MA TaxID=1132442 RepID=UPI0003681A0E|nr:lysozyme inhibitor LprI family protein [Bacillus sp. 37MA]
MKKLAVMVVISLFLVGCSNSTYDKAMEQAKLALANGEFDKALASFELALDEKPKDEEAKVSYENVVAYNQVKEDIEHAKWDDALTKANHLLKEEALVSSMKKGLEQFITTAETSKEQDKMVSEKVAQIKSVTSEKKYREAQKLISELKKDESIKTVFERFSKEINEMEHTVNDEIIKQEAAELAVEAAERAAKETVQTIASASKKNVYLQKLHEIELSLADLDYLYESGTTVEMREAESKTYTRWDNALNEIYSVLKMQLSTSEMNSLREKQREWITYRDNTAEAEAAQFKGGTFESVQYLSTLARLTKERCYELVNIYMK